MTLENTEAAEEGASLRVRKNHKVRFKRRGRGKRTLLIPYLGEERKNIFQEKCQKLYDWVYLKGQTYRDGRSSALDAGCLHSPGAHCGLL